jgi:hypothetical protein
MIEKSRMAEAMRKGLGKGMIQGRKKDSNEPFSTWHRDLAHCLILIFREAQSCTHAMYMTDHEGDEETLKEPMEALDTIVQMLMKIYSDSYENNLQGISHFAELYDYLDTPVKKDVYATFCSSFVQSVWCYMFTSGEMAIGLPKRIDNDTLDFQSVLNVVSHLDDDLRTKVIAQMSERGMIPTTVDFSKLKRRLDPFLDVIKEDQKMRYERMERDRKAIEQNGSGKPQ